MESGIKAFLLNGDRESGKMTLQASIPFSFLRDRVRFTYMEEPSYNPYAFNSDDTDSLRESGKKRFYQRRVDDKRVDAIKRYIRTSILDEYYGNAVGVLFPTSLLLAASYDDPLPEDGVVALPDMLSQDRKFFIVDGQHRLYSMMSLYEDVATSLQLTFFGDSENEIINKYLERYRFNCTILLNYDLWEQARVFADVNFNQRKVSRSLYYSIYGMWYSDNPKELRNNYIFIAHHLVNFLNSSPESPLKGMIKMLGNGDGLVSQSFVADALIMHIQSPRGIWYVDSMLDKTEGNYRYMAKELITFLTVIRNLFPSQWPVNGKHRSILLKTTGVGALMRLMGYIHKNLLDENVIASLNTADSNYLVQSYYEKLEKLLTPLRRRGETLFGFNGMYAGTGGRGLEGRLYRHLVAIIDSGDDEVVESKEVFVNGNLVRVLCYRDSEGVFSFELSSYFQNPDQISAYIPGSGSLAKSKEELDFKLKLYFDQVRHDARSVPNLNFDFAEWQRLSGDMKRP